MPTLKQIEAARRNGAKSKGPTHGLTASNKAIVLQNESDPVFQQLLDSCIDELAPATDLQLDLVQEIATLRWRLRRACTIETALLDHEMDSMAGDIERTFARVDSATRLALAFEQLSEKNSLALCLRYQAFLRRSCERALRDLQNLQSATPEPKATPEPEAPNTELRNEPKEDLTPAPATTEERPAAQQNRRERRRKSVRAQQLPRHLRPKRRARR